MKHNLFIFALAALVCSACYPTRIVTYSPAPYSTYYSTTVTPVRTHTTTTIAQAYSTNEDISLHLDLQAVGALFAQASTVQEFEQLLNSSNYPVTNLDLNGDGYIDYLRVLETVDGHNHVFLIQACLGQDIYQDVATLVAEVPSLTNYTVEIIGAPFIYGPSYYVRPVFVARPLIFDCFLKSLYSPWHSPWYWDHFPSHYRHPAPVFLNHYQAYINTFMSGHRFCHEVSYPKEPHFNGYDRMTVSNQRNDFAKQNPEKAFTVRNANTVKANSRSEKVVNAYDVRQNSEASKVTTVSSRSASSSTTSKTGRGSGQTSTTSTRSATTYTPSTSSSRSTSSSQVGTTSARSTSSSSVSTGSSSSRSGSTSARSTSSSTVSSGSSRSSSSSSARSGSSSSSRSSSTGSTVVNSRVSSSGSSTTSVRSSGSSSSSSSSSKSRSGSSSSSSRSRR